jgi:RNA polymerase sigma factor (TIGR02999 family)
MSDVTRILDRANGGDRAAAAELLPVVYEELRRLATVKMGQQPPGQTLQATALVHDAWLRLTGSEQASWHDRQHFFRAAATAMRHILVDHARAKLRAKRGEGRAAVSLDDVDLAVDAPPETLLLVDEALEALGREHPENAELVKLRYYVGLDVEETARVLGVSEKTIKRRWIHARAWLFREINRLKSL